VAARAAAADLQRRVVEAAKTANADEFVRALPEG
jgi:hypothetical protein